MIQVVVFFLPDVIKFVLTVAAVGMILTVCFQVVVKCNKIEIKTRR